MKTKLKYVERFDASDFGQGELEYQMLLRAQNEGNEVTILCVAVESGHDANNSSYDIQLSNGLRIDAISGIHLVNIEQFKPSSKREYQFCATVQFFSVDEVNTDVAEEVFKTALVQALSASGPSIAAHVGECTDVSFETSYPV